MIQLEAEEKQLVMRTWYKDCTNAQMHHARDKVRERKAYQKHELH